VDAGPARVSFDLEGLADDFFAFPFPSDLRLDAEGHPELTGFPNPRRLDLVDDLLPIAAQRPAWPVVPVAFFRFSAPLGERRIDDVIAATTNAEILLVDVDPDSPDRGQLAPVVAHTPPMDRTRGAHLLEISPRPGWVLHPERTYAFVVMRALGDAQGRALEVNETFSTLAAGAAPAASWGASAQRLYAPLWETLRTLDIDPADVAAATVLTTGDVVAEGRALSEQVLGAVDVQVEGLHLDPTDGIHPRYCELLGTVSMPQYQQGSPPFAEGGLFVLGPDGAPVEQRRESVPVVVTIPRGTMPAAGWPLLTYFHGSGGVAAQLVDRGPRIEGGEPAVGEGPAHVVAAHGLAAVGAAMPISPDRVPGATSYAYVNLENLAMTRDLFRQGVIEQRLLLEAMTRLTIDPALLEGCSGTSLPEGESAHRFDAGALVAMGQSMGGMYTNLIGAVEPRFRAFVPTGAGGYWSYFILSTTAIPGARGLVAALLQTTSEALTHTHPVMFLLELGLEPIDPMVAMPRVSRRPLSGIEARPIYEPVGQGDSYFTTEVYDAMALAYGHTQAGDVVWSPMQEALALDGRDGLAEYPVLDNARSESGAAYSGVVVQYAGDGWSDPHEIFVQLPEVRYQYGCFLRDVVRGGRGLVPAPASLDTPCPAL
jgi:hypothetical protein